ncbi:MAG: hypothetical protein U5L11_01070 [Arhodomonas sp.]|nr:hypothetical protein [Arhodomonas sp.]
MSYEATDWAWEQEGLTATQRLRAGRPGPARRWRRPGVLALLRPGARHDLPERAGPAQGVARPGGGRTRPGAGTGSGKQSSRYRLHRDGPRPGARPAGAPDAGGGGT